MQIRAAFFDVAEEQKCSKREIGKVNGKLSEEQICKLSDEWI